MNWIRTHINQSAIILFCIFFFSGTASFAKNHQQSGKDPIGWSLNHGFTNPIFVFGQSQTVQYTLTNQLPFTLVKPLFIAKETSSAAEFSYIDLCTGKRLAPNQSCTVKVQLTPKTQGIKTVTLVIKGYDQNEVPLPQLSTSAIPNPIPGQFSVGGDIFGLPPGGTLILQNNGDQLSTNVGGPFTFTQLWPSSSTYFVTVVSSPAGLTCTPDHNKGTITTSNITTVEVTCSINNYTIGGTVTGYASTEPLRLINNTGEIKSISQNGPYAFSTKYAHSSDYDVQVLSDPIGQECTVVGGTGTNITANVTNINVTCATTSYPLGVTVSGLLASEQVVLENDGEPLTVSANSPPLFIFQNNVAHGAQYQVTVATQPLNQTCTLTPNSSGTMLGPVIVGVSCVTNPTSVNTNTTNLLLSVKGHTEFGIPGNIPSGLARTITLTNSPSAVALITSITAPDLPTGTSLVDGCGGSIPAGGSCDITINPGTNATTSNGIDSCNKGTEPFPATITITGSNFSPISVKVTVLDYGCISQGGYVYALDDSPVASANVKGKVVSTTDQAAPFPNGIIWSSNGSGTYDGGVSIWGIDETSTFGAPSPNTFSTFPATKVPGQDNCFGATDGACNSQNIFVYYLTQFVNSSFYAAGRCKVLTNSGVTGWHLPAICDMINGISACPLNTVQNMVSNLMVYNNLNLLSGFYWSSTEVSAVPATFAWAVNFANPQTGIAGTVKMGLYGVRCSRAF